MFPLGNLVSSHYWLALVNILVVVSAHASNVVANICLLEISEHEFSHTKIGVGVSIDAGYLKWLRLACCLYVQCMHATILILPCDRVCIQGVVLSLTGLVFCDYACCLSE